MRIFFMKKILQVTVVVNLFLSLSLVNAPSAAACSCIEPGSVGESLNDAQAVFVGTVVEIEKSEGSVWSTDDPMKVTLAISKFWKGSMGQTVTVTTSRESASCGFPFEEGVEYLVYAYGEMDDLHVGLCGRTTTLLSAGVDLAALGEGTVVAEEETDSKEAVPVVETVFLIILGVGLFLYRRG